MKFYVSAEDFMLYRVAISNWLVERGAAFEINFHPSYQKAIIEFEKSYHAQDFAIAFEDFK